MKNKKGMSMMGKIVSLIIMVVVIVLLIQLPAWTGEIAEESGLRLACRKSLEISHNLRMIGGSLADGFGNVMNIDCSTKYLELTGSGEELNRDVADHIYDCFSLYGDRKDLFDTSSGTFCVICKVFSFHGADNLEGLTDFMKKENSPSITRKTYVNVMGGEQAFPKEAQQMYNYYALDRDEDIALIVTFGDSGFAHQRLVFNKETNVGLLLYPYDDISDLGCYAFEGRTTSLQYKR